LILLTVSSSRKSRWTNLATVNNSRLVQLCRWMVWYWFNCRLLCH
jgi:hypothetical protein